MADSIVKGEGSLAYVHSDDVFADVCQIIEKAQLVAQKAVDVTYVRRNWLLGRRIVEEELAGGNRARYGANVVPKLAEDLTLRYGRGYTKRSLWKYARFCRMFPEIVPTASAQSGRLLSWPHYEELMRIDDDTAHAWYVREAREQTWNVRTLRRNINTQHYERLLSTQVGLKNVDSSDQDDYETRLEFVKNPLMAEFLGLPADTAIHESELEGAIIANLQQFLLELGKGYAFVARQQHIRTDAGDFYIDLVFYNVVLKCYVLIDLKVGQITPPGRGADGHVRAYVRRAEAHGGRWAHARHRAVLGDEQGHRALLDTQRQQAALRLEVQALPSHGGAAVRRNRIPEGDIRPPAEERRRLERHPRRRGLGIWQ